MSESKQERAPNALLVCAAKVLAIALALVVLAISVALAPHPDGQGTLPQLFESCPLGRGGAMRCPTCGMTGAFTAMARGRFIEAARRNLLAPLLALVIALAAGYSLASLKSGTPILELPLAMTAVRLAPLVIPLAAILYTIMLVSEL